MDAGHFNIDWNASRNTMTRNRNQVQLAEADERKARKRACHSISPQTTPA
jgi:hypothetical protein